MNGDIKLRRSQTCNGAIRSRMLRTHENIVVFCFPLSRDHHILYLPSAASISVSSQIARAETFD